MNPVARQVQKTLVSPRRFGFVSVAVFVGVALYFIVAFPVVKNAASVVQYESGGAVWATIEPDNSVLCPGETMAYSVTISIASAPAAIDILEAWCVPERQCPREFKLPPDFSIAKEAGNLGSFTASRVVPDLPPGEWEFRHINVTTVHGEEHREVALSGYSLYITVPESCTQ